MEKLITKASTLNFNEDFPGLNGINIMEKSFPIEPFLVFTEFHMNQAVFGPHPHAGISVMTYMLPDSEGSFINRDSQGDHSIIEPGGVHIMQAGSGMHHDEYPSVAGVDCHGFQIWINHSTANRMATPMSMHAMASDVPEVETDDYKLRIVHGAFNTVKTKYQMLTDVNLYHVFIHANKSITLDTKEMAFVFVLKGTAQISEKEVPAHTLVNFSEDGNQVTIHGLGAGVELMFATGTPHKEPIVYGGPFVMSSIEQLTEAKRNYAQGKMGIL